MINIVTINTIIITLISIVIAIIAFEYILKQVRKLLGQNGDISQVRKIINIFRLIFYIFLIFVCLGAFGISLTGLLVASGFLGIVIGLAFQVTFANFIAGVYITLTGMIKLNQTISINAIGSNILVTGQIQHLGLSHIELYADDIGIRLIPNSLFLTSILTIHSDDI